MSDACPAEDSLEEKPASHDEAIRQNPPATEHIKVIIFSTSLRRIGAPEPVTLACL